MSKPDVVFINNVDQFANAIENWHKQKIKVLEELMKIPEGELQVGIDGEEPLFIKLHGIAHSAFITGVSMALMEFISLPFVTEIEDNNSPTLDNSIH